MNKLFYPKLAADNMKKNAAVYLPYLITCILTVSMYYIIQSLAKSDSLSNLKGGSYVASFMSMGCMVATIFAIIFLFYTNSFLIKRRKKEFGLYNILGMEKKHISIILFFESIYVTLISLSLGLVTGILFSKLFFLFLLKMLDFDVQLGFEISIGAIGYTIKLFSFIFMATFINNLRHIHLALPIELLKGDNVGEKEPKGSLLITLFGLLSLGSGYALATIIKNAGAALLFFFVAVILVVIGTYCLFISGSITLLKMLRKNKKFYYQTNHFISISGMIYRMKQNAVGLANICILSTMVLVMISSTICLFLGIEDSLEERYPHEFTYYLRMRDTNEIDEIDFSPIMDAVHNAVDETAIANEITYRYLNASFSVEDKKFEPVHQGEENYINLTNLNFMKIEDYNRLYDTDLILKDNEVLIAGVKNDFPFETLELFEKTYLVNYANRIPNGRETVNIMDSYFVIVNGQEYAAIYDKIADFEENISLTGYYGFDISKDDEYQQNLFNQLLSNEAIEPSWLEARALQRPELRSLYGGFLFLGIFLGMLFIMATVLIMYYKQITEGYEDRKRFAILRKVGLSKEEVSQVIRSQVLIVFFLPLIMAALHIAFAFNLIEILFSALILSSVSRLLPAVLITFVIFTVFYILVYMMTARVYTRIVSVEE